MRVFCSNESIFLTCDRIDILIAQKFGWPKDKISIESKFNKNRCILTKNIHMHDATTLTISINQYKLLTL